MVYDLKALRTRIRELGVAEVARMTRVPATTLYSFCQNPERELAFSTAMAVGQVLENLRARDQHAAAVTHGLKPESVHGVPVFPQTGSYKAFLHPVGRAVNDNRRWFDQAWLRSLSRGGMHHFAIVTVVETALSPLLQVGDEVLMSDAQSLLMSKQPGIYAVADGDHLGFVRCERADTPASRDRLAYKASSKPNAPKLDFRSLQIVGKVLWIGRSLVGETSSAAAASSAAPRKRPKSKRSPQR